MRPGRVLAAAALALAAAPASAAAALPPMPDPGAIAPLSSEIQHLHFKYGPIFIAPGGNLILIGPVTIEKPGYDGYMVGFKPNLVRADGSVPPIEQVHLHHAVWLNLSRRDATAGDLPGERFAASGEEKTAVKLQTGYGYPVRASDVWALNYMVHNETASPQVVWITYDVDYVPATTPLAHKLVPVRPIWMDVENGKSYPVFDVLKGAGRRGKFTYPDNGPRVPRHNVWTADQNGTLVWTAGHVHPGGLWDDLFVQRGRRSHLIFRSKAKYFDPHGPVSWDMAMTNAPANWHVAIHKGDRLHISSTYETRHAAWYESMGIMISWLAPAERGTTDPFRNPRAIPTSGVVNHGHLPEASNYGGAPTGLPDPAKAANGQTIENGVAITNFEYVPGDLTLSSPFGNPPVIKKGQQIAFGNLDASSQIFHTITACRDPCTGSTGITYPLANGAGGFDSAELGYGPTGLTAASNKNSWVLPTNRLAPGTYTYFCRIHPFMRGAFRVIR